MAYITEYYFDLKIIDKTAPVKRRLEIFRRSTKAHLMSVPAASIPDNGIFVTTSLDPTIPAKDIFAIAFDDVTNRQLAGADKLSIKSRQVWVDQTVALHLEYVPGETANERVSNTPLTIYQKSTEQDFVNGTLTTFNNTTPTITEYGLLYHRLTNNYMKNNYIVDTNTTVSQTTKNGLTLCEVRETASSGIHSCKNIISEITQVADAYATKTLCVTRYIKPINRTRFNIKIYQSNLTTLLADISFNTATKTCTVNTGLEARIEVDPRFPDYYVLEMRFTLPTNILIGLEVVSLLDDLGIASYTGNVNNGINIWNPVNDMNSIGYLKYNHTIPVTTSAVQVNSIINANCYYYLASNLSPAYLSTFNFNNNLPQGYSIMMDVVLSFTADSVYLKPKLASNTTYHIISGAGGTSCVCFQAQELSFIYSSVDAKTVVAVKAPSFKPFDVLRFRIIGSIYDNLPSNIKTTYSVPNGKGFCRVILENLTQGTKVVHNSTNGFYCCNPGFATSNTANFVAANGAPTIGPFYVKKIKVWDKPLPTDWETWI